MKFLITGGAGFVGHHVAEHILRNTAHAIVFLDRLDVSGNLNRIVGIDGWEQFRNRCAWVYHDLRAPIGDWVANKLGHIDVILHFAAATHVDRSIEDPLGFVYDNVVGTANLLEYARCTRLMSPPAFVYLSTDEVFGPAVPGQAFAEDARYRSGNPYAASKAGAEELCVAYHNTYRLPVKIVHSMNVFGERQHPEKFIPGTIMRVLRGLNVIIHADATRTHPGSRFYIHARNLAAAILFILDHGEPGEKFNVAGEREVDNLQLARMIAEIVGRKLHYTLVDFHSARPGHDLRYALDGTKLREMGWQSPVDFERSLEATVRWTLAHKEWLA